jgi:hypothetical protein
MGFFQMDAMENEGGSHFLGQRIHFALKVGALSGFC